MGICACPMSGCRGGVLQGQGDFPVTRTVIIILYIYYVRTISYNTRINLTKDFFFQVDIVSV